MGQIEKNWCLSDREFPEFFKNGPTFYSSSTQWPSVTIFHKSQFFLGHPVDKFPKKIQGVHKKSLRYVWKAIEPLRIEVGIKVRGVLESAGAELSWTYHNFSVAHLGPEIFKFKVGPVPKKTFYNVISLV